MRISTLRRVRDESAFVAAACRAGLFAPTSPPTTVRTLQAYRRHGALGGILAASALRFPERTALVDEAGSLTFRELDDRVNALAQSWLLRGLAAGDGVSILARNHRGFLEATFAAARCGARLTLLNTDFSGPQLRDVAAREGTDLLVCDAEYLDLLDGLSPRLGVCVAGSDDVGEHAGTERLIRESPTLPPPRPARPAQLTLLTSGTTGQPKGALREEPRSLAPFGVMLERIPFRSREVTVLAAPMFHTLGFSHALLAIALGSTVVLRRRFDPALTLQDAAAHRATAIIAVPVMMRRVLDLDPAPEGLDLSALRIVFVAGSTLGGDLCRRLTARFGPVVYNLYGSTEVAYATIATPADLRIAPDTVGRPCRGTVVRIYDDEGRVAPVGEPGRIFVGNSSQFRGYSDGSDKHRIDGLMSSGDVGHLDADGLLFVDGRDDDMIVSGGENVFPSEVEEFLASRPDIVEAAVVGVPDEEFGRRLAAYVVAAPGSRLSADDVRAAVRENLARYKVPRDVHLVDELPRNPTGKVLKRALAPSNADGGTR